MTGFRRLSETVFASPQITPDDIAAAREAGVTLVINNRPDGEAEDQPPGARIEAAAREAGMDYRAIPVGGAGFGEPQVEAMAEAGKRPRGGSRLLPVGYALHSAMVARPGTRRPRPGRDCGRRAGRGIRRGPGAPGDRHARGARQGLTRPDARPIAFRPGPLSGPAHS